MCLVSVIVPVYNNEKYIRKCIQSLQKQTLSDIEIIVINDGSTDDSPNIVKKLMDKDPRIRLIEQKNQGVSVARNKGIQRAKGSYLTFVDGDDYLRPDYLDSLCHCAFRYGSEIVIGGLTLVDDSGRFIKEIVPDHYSRFSHEEWPMRISAVGAHLYKHSFWKKHQISFYSGERGEDIPIALYCNAMCDKISVIDNPGYMYVQHPGSGMTGLKGLRQHSVPYKGMEIMIRRIRKEGIVNSREFHELFVLRILATFLFLLGPGSDWDKMKELCDYIVYILQEYYPGYSKNALLDLFKPLDITFKEKLAVKLLIILVKYKLLYLFSKCICYLVRNELW